MNVLVVEPDTIPYEKEINGLAEMQAVVGGLIDAIYPFEEQVAVVCNDEGLLLDMPFNRSMEGGYYDAKKLELAVNPNYPDNEAFAAIAAEVAHSRMHARGVNSYYSREECSLDAQSVSCILCRRFGIQRESPDLSRLSELYQGWTPQEVRQALDTVQSMSKKIGNSIDRNIAPQEHTRSSHARRPER